ncbi:MAG: histidine--tRNA ligase [Thermoguttaceae bacterium]|nr:histidine--tRNA ligase [Thermoguttaceae bacterium]
MSSSERIQPRTLKGFRDYLPEVMMPREHLMEIARQVYRRYGFSPIDTPALEYLEILAGKGGEETDKQLYRFQDHGGRWVGLRFDLTVPLARFVAQHAAQLPVPFKRYHIGPVWRGENTQRGRYREFVQCDFDIIGTRSAVADIETLQVVYDLMLALGFQQFTIRVNHRGILSGLLERLGLADRQTAVLRALDKLDKIGPGRVAEEITQAAGASAEQVQQILALGEMTGSNEGILNQAEALVVGSSAGQEAVARLREVLAGLEAAGVPGERVRLHLALARGLDYYTGMVFETLLDQLPEIGSVCSGGRYDNLAGLYTSQDWPGVGGSLGLDRLLAAMEALDRLQKVGTPAPVFIAYFDPQRLADYLRLAASLRRAGLGVELYPEPKKLSQQLKYADRRGFRLAVIAGSEEFAASVCQLKDLCRQSQQTVPLEPDAHSLIQTIRQILSESPPTNPT